PSQRPSPEGTFGSHSLHVENLASTPHTPDFASIAHLSAFWSEGTSRSGVAAGVGGAATGDGGGAGGCVGGQGAGGGGWRQGVGGSGRNPRAPRPQRGTWDACPPVSHGGRTLSTPSPLSRSPGPSQPPKGLKAACPLPSLPGPLLQAC